MSKQFTLPQHCWRHSEFSLFTTSELSHERVVNSQPKSSSSVRGIFSPHTADNPPSVRFGSQRRSREDDSVQVCSRPLASSSSSSSCVTISSVDFTGHAAAKVSTSFFSPREQPPARNNSRRNLVWRRRNTIIDAKMSLNRAQATKEHVLAVSRDFISQPRLSKYPDLYGEENWPTLIGRGNLGRGKSRSLLFRMCHVITFICKGLWFWTLFAMDYSLKCVVWAVSTKIKHCFRCKKLCKRNYRLDCKFGIEMREISCRNVGF